MKLFSYESIRYILLNAARYPLSVATILKGKRFACNALSGESSYNIAVNSDFTVSCNCTDYYKTGQIGDLNTSTFKEIFSSPEAHRLRSELAKGRLPLFQCVLCADRRTVPRKEAAAPINTIACNPR